MLAFMSEGLEVLLAIGAIILIIGLVLFTFRHPVVSKVFAIIFAIAVIICMIANAGHQENDTGFLGTIFFLSAIMSCYTFGPGIMNSKEEGTGKFRISESWGSYRVEEETTGGPLKTFLLFFFLGGIVCTIIVAAWNPGAYIIGGVAIIYNVYLIKYYYTGDD